MNPNAWYFVAASPDAQQASFTARRQAEGMETSGQRVIAPGNAADPLPLSFAQERLWFMEQLEPGRPTHNIAAAARLHGSLDIATLEWSLTEIARRHEVLRTTFVAENGQPVQVIAEAERVAVPVVDLTSWPESEREAEAERLASEQARRPFDPARGPLLRPALLRLSELEHVLLMTMHRIVSDGWSLVVLYRELAALYMAYAQGQPSPLSELPVQYADYALWQRERLRGEVLEAQLRYWKQQLAGAPPALDLPTDHPRPAVQTLHRVRESLALSESLSQALTALSRQEAVGPSMILLAAFDVLLSRCTGQEDIVVGAPVAGHTRSQTDGLIGLFRNHLALRADLSGNPTFRELLGRMRQVCLGAYAHQELPFERLLQELRPERDQSRAPVFQVVLDVLDYPAYPTELGRLTVRPVELSSVASDFDLTLRVRESQKRIHFDLTYNPDLFTASRMAELLRQLELLLSQVVDAPDERLAQFSLVTPTARAVLPDPTRELSAAWEGSVQTIFSRQARRAPEQPAVVYGDDVWSYGELHVRSNQLAHRLLASGIARGEIVAIYGRRSPSLVWAVLGVLKAGAAFTILDPAYPAARLIDCLRVAGPSAWLELEAAGDVPESVDERLADTCRCRLILPERAAAASDWLGECSPEDPEVAMGPDDLAYVCFTSGSSGTPKGVLGRHGPLSHFVPWQRERFGFSESDRYSMLSGLAHSTLQRDLFVPLQLGATICIPGADDMQSSARLADWMSRSGITIAHLTPALLQLLTGTDADASAAAPIGSLRWAFIVGDVLTRRDVARLKARAPAVTCVNHYGATETQRAVGCFVVPDAWLTPHGTEPGTEYSKEIVPLGQGTPDVQLLVLNTSQQLAGIGEFGEIYVRSPHLGRGYLGDDALTTERFLTNWFTRAANDRLYRTGDMGRYLPDGTIEPLGRRDTQVKIRSYRVELGEVEVALTHHPGVGEAAVLAREDHAGERSLVAYVVPRSGPAPAAGELRSYLRERLPEYMVPAVFVPLEALPLTPNGKVDRRALPTPEWTRDYLGTTFVAPRTPAERELARLWADLLGLERVGIHDDFFDLGGHSLLAAQLLHRIQTAFGVELTLRTVFEARTLAAFAEAIVHQQAARAGEEELARLLGEIEGHSSADAQGLLHAQAP